jgi:hypothetical protein
LAVERRVRTFQNRLGPPVDPPRGDSMKTSVRADRLSFKIIEELPGSNVLTDDRDE